ncbi:sensor histidine kinase [Marinobacter sp. VGCF2001]|uniref:sensor histidine kinase n=1 Tax=Marinobacter sp. VGCF2001 TaxID=3417189 RepID=UPI003CF0FE16
MTAEEIQQQQARGFRTLRFMPALEADYRQVRSALVRQRARLASLAGLVLFLVYALVDLMTLPPELARLTAGIRLLLTCPIIATVLWLAHHHRPDDLAFERLYVLAYLAGGLSVIAIILVARWQAYPLPYEGMILMLMFGYFAMGLPFFEASAASLILVVTYLLAELWAGYPVAAAFTNLFFLFTANVIGMVGAWISEYRHRAHFLDRQLLDLMHQAAEDESRRKTELITAASHDLRQPLNVIELTLASLQPDHSHPQLLNQLRGTVSQLRNLLGTVLDSARLNAGMVRPDISTVSLAAVLQELGDLLTETLTRRDIQLDIPPLPPSLHLRADPSLLLRVLQNLVINAADHSGGRHILVTAVAADGHAQIRVCDDGCGLSGDLHDRVFTPYVRAPKSGQPGLGLGLTIVREFTRLMQGRCGTERPLARGAVFWVSLPLAATTSRRPAPGSHTRCDCAPPTG